MDSSTFARHFPRLYHLTFASNLPGIRANGLLSTEALADRFTPEDKAAALNGRRRCIQEIEGVTLRDQHAAVEAKMKSCLVGVTIPEWLTLLNGKIFFYVSREKVDLLAKAYDSYSNVLLEIDTAELLATHAEHASLCRINSGSFLYNPRPRGRASFIPLAAYTYKNKRDTPAELTMDRPIPEILRMSVTTLLA